MKNVHEKIKVKGDPRRYKGAPRPSGRERLQQRLWNLMAAAKKRSQSSRAAQDERLWMADLADDLVKLIAKYYMWGHSEAVPPPKGLDKDGRMR